MKKSKKKLKGMTLVEMIISIAIFGIMGGLLILVGTHVDATTRAGNNLKNKVLDESPYAANHVKKYYVGDDEHDLPKEEMDISVELNLPSKGEYWTYEIDDKTGDKIEVKKEYGPNIKVEMKADKYGTEPIITEGMTPEEIVQMRDRANGKLNLEFFEVQPTTEPTTDTEVK